MDKIGYCFHLLGITLYITILKFKGFDNQQWIISVEIQSVHLLASKDRFYHKQIKHLYDNQQNIYERKFNYFANH